MLNADEVIAVVRVHADRVHDAVRRLGCAPAAAVEVVEASAHDLIAAAAADTVTDPVGWWFARARGLGEATAAPEDDDLPVGGGVLGVDANQVRLAEALESRPELERAALLLRDSYDLPAVSVGTTLGVDAARAMEIVGQARMAFLPELLGGAPLSLAGHQTDLGAIARLAEGGQPAARDATTRRHIQSCARCADALDAMERARRLLSGLTVVALPDDLRSEILDRVDAHARSLLAQPEPEPELDDEDWDDEPRRPYSLALITLGFIVAVGLGIGGGILASRGDDDGGTSTNVAFPLITAPPAIFVKVPVPTVGPTPSVSPTPNVFLVTPSPTPTPTVTVTPTSVVSATATASTGTLTPVAFLNPGSGPNDTKITITGTGWTPNAQINLSYLDSFGGAVGNSGTAQTDDKGSFTAELTAHDQLGTPGAHDVDIDDGTSALTLTFNATQ